MASATAMPTESVVDAETLMLHPRRNRREKSRTLLILPVSIWFGLRRESSRDPRHQRERNVSVVAAWHDGQYKFGFPFLDANAKSRGARGHLPEMESTSHGKKEHPSAT